jgi:4,5-DOPA dioxygenase extradiol
VALGRALAALADEGVLVMGSGLLTHNLRQLAPPGSPIFPWAREFDDWFTAKLQAEATDDLVHYRERAPHATVAHPRDEHLLPIYIAYGAAGAGTRAVPIHRSFEYGGLSMASWRFDPAP